ncbi:hypothetical protein GQ54DRAFT_59071 [Martensiomyces pterosporus]|nr:hypothetical protein GQ54DRAFT_59071 [Martensiomyces pterosporus]
MRATARFFSFDSEQHQAAAPQFLLLLLLHPPNLQTPPVNTTTPLFAAWIATGKCIGPADNFAQHKIVDSVYLSISRGTAQKSRKRRIGTTLPAYSIFSW